MREVNDFIRAVLGEKRGHLGWNHEEFDFSKRKNVVINLNIAWTTFSLLRVTTSRWGLKKLSQAHCPSSHRSKSQAKRKPTPSYTQPLLFQTCSFPTAASPLLIPRTSLSEDTPVNNLGSGWFLPAQYLLPGQGLSSPILSWSLFTREAGGDLRRPLAKQKEEGSFASPETGCSYQRSPAPKCICNRREVKCLLK